MRSILTSLEFCTKFDFFFFPGGLGLSVGLIVGFKFLVLMEFLTIFCTLFSSCGTFHISYSEVSSFVASYAIIADIFCKVPPIKT